jgi:oxygen-independent coproporphyrinogen-3 oxidase
MAGLGLYVQIPFCASKCTFCNFSSRVAPSTVFDDYCAAVAYEAKGLGPALREAGGRGEILEWPVDTVYFGGGTPPIVGMERLRAIIEGLRHAFHLTTVREFTIEATPGSLNAGMLQAIRGMGVNRLSIGAQSFINKELASVGRLHSVDDTLGLTGAARQAGFDNISLDLIAGLPHQTAASWQESLDVIARVHPEHVSVYIFEIDAQSRLGAEVLKHGSLVQASQVPDEAFVVDAYETARAFLKALGYHHYEISNFALPGCESLHNLKYWQLEPYVGFGAGAHSFDGEHRWSNAVSPAEYAEKVARHESPIAEFRTLSWDELIEEFFFTGLRQADGIDLAQAGTRWGSATVGRWDPAIAALESRGLIARHGARIKLAEKAYLISNEIFQEFLGVCKEVESA